MNVDAVPENKRTHPDFLGLLNDMTLGGMTPPGQRLRKFSRPDYRNRPIPTVCTECVSSRR